MKNTSSKLYAESKKAIESFTQKQCGDKNEREKFLFKEKENFLMQVNNLDIQMDAGNK